MTFASFVKRKTFLRKYNQRNGWYVNWADLLDEAEIYALVVEGSVDIQGLVARQFLNTLHYLQFVYYFRGWHTSIQYKPHPCQGYMQWEIQALLIIKS